MSAMLKRLTKAEFWNRFYSVQQQQPCEWYSGATGFVDIIFKYLQIKNKKCLIVGCGTSFEGETLFLSSIQRDSPCNQESLFNSIHCVDFSEVAIKEMLSKPNLRCFYSVCDARNLATSNISPHSLSCYVDKGCSDAFESDFEGMKDIFKECSRVLIPNLGRAFIITPKPERVSKAASFALLNTIAVEKIAIAENVVSSEELLSTDETYFCVILQSTC